MIDKYEISRLAARTLNEVTILTLTDDVTIKARRAFSTALRTTPPETIAQLQQAAKSTIPGAFELLPDLFNQK